MNHKLITDRLFYQKVLSIMLPVALQQTINMGVNMLDTMMLGQMGEVQISASSLANQYYNFFTISAWASSAAAVSLPRNTGVHET